MSYFHSYPIKITKKQKNPHKGCSKTSEQVNSDIELFGEHNVVRYDSKNKIIKKPRRSTIEKAAAKLNKEEL